MYKKLDIKWYTTIDSTNMQAQREMHSAEEGSVWVADFQTSGRGQRGNVWESAKSRNLMFTILFKPDFLLAQEQFLISQTVALAIVNYLKNRGLVAKIKWPNDIYCGDRKICGILIENAISGANLSASIAGIGININQTRFDSDAPNPTSLLLESNSLLPGDYADLEEFDRKEELQALLEEITRLYALLCEGEEEYIRGAYLNAMYRKEGYHKFMDLSGRAEGMSEDKCFEARIIGPDRYGCLLLERRDGTRSNYAFQEVRYII